METDGYIVYSGRDDFDTASEIIHNEYCENLINHTTKMKYYGTRILDAIGSTPLNPVMYMALVNAMLKYDRELKS